MHINLSDPINQAIILSIIADVVAIAIVAIAIYKLLTKRPLEVKRPYIVKSLP